MVIPQNKVYHTSKDKLIYNHDRGRRAVKCVCWMLIVGPRSTDAIFFYTYGVLHIFLKIVLLYRFLRNCRQRATKNNLPLVFVTYRTFSLATCSSAAHLVVENPVLCEKRVQERLWSPPKITALTLFRLL